MPQTLVDSGEAASSASSVAITLNSTGAGRLIINASAGSDSTSVADTVGGSATGNVWTKRILQGGGARNEIWDCLSPVMVGGTHVITVSQGGASDMKLHAMALSGPTLTFVSAEGTFDGASQVTSAVSCSTPINGGAANNFYVAGLSGSLFFDVSSIGIGSGFTLPASMTQEGGLALATAYFNQSGAAAVQPTWTWASNARYSAAMVGYAESGGGSSSGAAAHYYRQMQ